MSHLSPFSPAPLALRRAALAPPLLLALLLAAGCAEEPAPQVEQVVAPNTSGLGMMGGGIGDDPEGVDDDLVVVDEGRIYEDDAGSWDGWTLAAPEQTWVEPAMGKWIGFGPKPNQAFSPPFERGTSELRVSFALFVPDNFPVRGHMQFITRRHLFGLASHNMLSGEPAAGAMAWLDVELAQSVWRLVPGSRSESGAAFSGPELDIPWAFTHGWNQVQLTVRARPGRADDDLELRVGDKVYAWTELDLFAEAVPFRHVTLGRWEPGPGDEIIAIRNLEVLDLTPSDVLMASPPTGVDYARGGYRVPSGFWRGWMVRRHSRDNCGSTTCTRFYDRGDYGAMRDHTQGVFWMGTGRERAGQVSLRVRFHGTQLTSTGAGRHLLSITSRPLCFTPRDYGLSTWTRVDFDRPEPGRVRAVVFNVVDGVRINGGAWPTRRFEVPFATDRWADMTVGWRMDGNRLTVTVNRVSHTFELLRGSEPVGIYLGLGNMDPISGVIDFDDIRIH